MRYDGNAMGVKKKEGYEGDELKSFEDKNCNYLEKNDKV